MEPEMDALALRAFWDGLVRGEPGDADAVDPASAAAIARLHALYRPAAPDPAFVARLEERLIGGARDADGSAAPFAVNGYRPAADGRALVPPLPTKEALRSMPPVGGAVRRRGRWALDLVAMAALLMVTFGGVYVAFVQSRTGQGALGIRDAVEATSGATVEALVDATIAEMPAERHSLYVKRGTLQPGSNWFGKPVPEVPSIVAVAIGRLDVAVGGRTRTLAAGEYVTVPARQEFALRNAGSTEATVFLISGDFNYGPYDPLSIQWEDVLSPYLATFPGAPTRIVLERFTLAPGTALPPFETTESEWLTVADGVLGVTLEGEQLPLPWTSGVERTLLPWAKWPTIPVGARVTLRNLGDEPLVLHHLSFTPLKTDCRAFDRPAGECDVGTG